MAKTQRDELNIPLINIPAMTAMTSVANLRSLSEDFCDDLTGSTLAFYTKHRTPDGEGKAKPARRRAQTSGEARVLETLTTVEKSCPNLWRVLNVPGALYALMFEFWSDDDHRAFWVDTGFLPLKTTLEYEADGKTIDVEQTLEMAFGHIQGECPMDVEFVSSQDGYHKLFEFLERQCIEFVQDEMFTDIVSEAEVENQTYTTAELQDMARILSENNYIVRKRGK
jgi:hypothetical protein